MKHIIRTPVKTLITALCLSAASFAPALAQSGSYSDTAYASDYDRQSVTDITGAIPLPEMSPEQIAADVVREYDPATGLRVSIAPTFDPFEGDTDLAGTALLRTGASSTALDGQRVIGGAYLDLSMIYTTATDDPFDVRSFERAVYVSGQPVSRTLQDTKTLDCSTNTTEVVYDEGYNRGSSYGYLGGLYVLFPRYRGHRGYGRGYGHSRGYGSYGYGRRGHRGYRRGRGHDDGYGRGTGRGSGDGDRRRRRRGHDGDTGSDRGDRGNGHKKVKIDPITRPSIDSERSRERRRMIRDATGTTPERPRRRRTGASPSRDSGASKSKKRRIVPVSRPDTRPTSRKATRSVSKRRPNPVSRPAPRSVSKSRVKAPVSRPVVSRPNVSRPAPQSRPVSKPQKASKPRPVSRPKRDKVDRAADRAFKKHKSPKAGRHMNFFPLAPIAASGYARTDVYQSARCVREEKVTLHIPQDRLDAARFDGLTIIMLDQAGAEVPVYLPPNYIEGFRKAVQGYGGTVTYQGQTSPSSYGTSQPSTVPYGSGGSYPLNDTAPVQGHYPQQ